MYNFIHISIRHKMYYQCRNSHCRKYFLMYVIEPLIFKLIKDMVKKWK